MKLYVMTGDFMTGKTTWIIDMLERPEAQALDIAGVISPAVFGNGKKTGIDALLVPDGERLELARPRTGEFVDERSAHSGANPDLDPNPNPNPEQLGWKFSAEAMACINEHFAACEGCGLLIVDEIGPLELMRGQGYIEALHLLDTGSPDAALVVIRPALLEVARERWGDFEELTPESDAAAFLAGL